MAVGQTRQLCAQRNHEMYARGNGYFNSILPKMGLRKSGADWGDGQWASFFCLENKYWRVIGLDTSYNATAFDWAECRSSKKVMDS